MSDQSQQTPDPAGIDRTATGEIAEPKPPTHSTTTTEPAPEPKPEPKADGKPSLVNQKEVVGAPEKYEDFKVPEDFALDPEISKEVQPLFKELNLSQEGAQRLIDFYIDKTRASAEEPYKVWAETQENWIKEVKADPEIGGKLPQVKETISRALSSIGDEKLVTEFKQAMDFTGAGNNPAFIRAFYRMAQQLTEGRHVAGGGPSPHGQRSPSAAPESAAKAMYPNLP